MVSERENLEARQYPELEKPEAPENIELGTGVKAPKVELRPTGLSPAQLAREDFEDEAGVWTTQLDDQVCKACQVRHGQPTGVGVTRYDPPPHEGCRSEGGCRCTVVPRTASVQEIADSLIEQYTEPRVVRVPVESRSAVDPATVIDSLVTAPVCTGGRVVVTMRREVYPWQQGLTFEATLIGMPQGQGDVLGLVTDQGVEVYVNGNSTEFVSIHGASKEETT